MNCDLVANDLNISQRPCIQVRMSCVKMGYGLNYLKNVSKF